MPNHKTHIKCNLNGLEIRMDHKTQYIYTKIAFFERKRVSIDANEMSSQAMSIERLRNEQCICGSVELDRIGLTTVTTRKITYNGNILI